MSRGCPKCQYIRKPGDTAPDWQCPSCGVAYAKYINRNISGEAPAPVPAGCARSRGLVPVTLLLLVLALFIGISLAYSNSSNNSQTRVVQTNGSVRVVLYGTQSCGYCRRVRTWFDRAGIRYVDKDIGHSRQAWQEFRELGGRGVPVLIIGDNVIHGYNRRSIERALRNAGVI